MMYEWKNKEGEVVEHDHWSVPPSLPGKWTRVYSFGTGRVEGAGGSPSRVSMKTDEKPPAQTVYINESNLKVFDAG
jgi:hypothetical protein